MKADIADAAAGPESRGAKAKALARLRRARADVAPDQDYAVARLGPGDALGVARLVYAVYGDGYPQAGFYDPAHIEAANRDGRVVSVVARTPGGDVVGHAALYRSSPPNPRLYELGQMLTLPSYRNSMAAYRMVDLLARLLDASPGLDGGFGEAVTYVAATQKFAVANSFAEMALEPALMPAGSYALEGAGGRRVGCVLSFRITRDRPQTLYLPPRYRQQAACMLDGTGLARELVFDADAAATEPESRLTVERFDFAGVVRCHVAAVGLDLAERVEAVERSALADGVALVQVFLALGRPAAALAVEGLREKGYFMGGLVPLWFGADGWLMQKLAVPPDFADMVLYSDKAKTLMEMAAEDWRGV